MEIVETSVARHKITVNYVLTSANVAGILVLTKYIDDHLGDMANSPINIGTWPIKDSKGSHENEYKAYRPDHP